MGGNGGHLFLKQKVSLGQTLPLYCILSESIYPEMLSVSSTGFASSTHPQAMGIYSKMPWVTKNERPVWKKFIEGENDHYIFYGNAFVWRISYQYIKDVAYIGSNIPHQNAVPYTDWYYWDGKGWWEDATLKVVPQGEIIFF